MYGSLFMTLFTFKFCYSDPPKIVLHNFGPTLDSYLGSGMGLSFCDVEAFIKCLFFLHKSFKFPRRSDQTSHDIFSTEINTEDLLHI